MGSLHNWQNLAILFLAGLFGAFTFLNPPCSIWFLHTPYGVRLKNTLYVLSLVIEQFVTFLAHSLKFPYSMTNISPIDNTYRARKSRLPYERMKTITGQYAGIPIGQDPIFMELLKPPDLPQNKMSRVIISASRLKFHFNFFSLSRRRMQVQTN